MKKSALLGMCLAAILSAGTLPASAQSHSPSTQWHWNKGKIMIDSPERPAGQKDVIGLTLPKMKTVRVGFVGLGMRGPDAVADFALLPGVEIVALCDFEEPRAAKLNETLRKHGLAPAAIYSGAKGYEALCSRDDIDLVYIATDWEHHAVVARCALEHGKNVADEVPSAMNLEECWQLVNLAEQKQLNCMILENCCYDWFEMRTLNMAQHGVFGEILRAQGAYIHNLDDFWDYYWKNPDGSDPDQLGWRLKYNRDNRGDLYATHGLGPVAQALDIHRGDRMVTLVSMDTKSVHGKELVEAKTGKPCDNFRNGDHTTTLIRTENQKVIELQHDVMNPQPYNRLYQLTGTRGFANKYPIEGYALDSKQLSASGVQPKVDNLSTHSFMPEAERKALEEKYDHPILKKFGKLAKEVGGHGGMDFVMTARLVYCLQNGLPLDMDVYDLAEWCSIAELSALSLDNDCAPVAVPDFTRGLWDRQKGYRHAYASPEEEAATEATAKAFTKAYKEATAKLRLWELYDKVAQAKSETARRKAQAALDKATAGRALEAACHAAQRLSCGGSGTFPRGDGDGGVLRRAVGVEEGAGEVGDRLSAPAHDHAGAFGDDCNAVGLQVFGLRGSDELFLVLRRDDDRHALLRFGDRKLGAVQPLVLLAHGVKLDGKAVGQLADGNRHAARAKVVAALDEARHLAVSEQALDLALFGRVALLHFACHGGKRL